MKRQKGKLDQKQNTQFDVNHKKIYDVLAKASSNLKRCELKRDTQIKSYATIRKHIEKFIKNGQVKEDQEGKLVLTERYFESLGDSLAALVRELQTTLAYMLKPKNVWRWKCEGKVSLPDRMPVNTDPDAPAIITLMTNEEMNEFFEHKEKVFGGLRSCFFNLAQVVMKVDVGLVDAEEDLSNVQVCFRNGRAVWTIHPTKEARK